MGLNPLVCGMAIAVVGDAVVYYPAQSPSGVFKFTRAYLAGHEVFRLGMVITFATMTSFLPSSSHAGACREEALLRMKKIRPAVSTETRAARRQ